MVKLTGTAAASCSQYKRYGFWLLAVLLLTACIGALAVPITIPKITLPIKEDCIPFSYMNASVKQIDGHWKVVDGNMYMLDFNTNEAQARQALAVIKFYHMNSQCFVGRPNPPMQYYLVDGKAPAGPMAGEDQIPFNLDTVEVKQIGGRWKVVDGDHYMLDFNANQDQANTALAIIKKYGFNHICFVGRPNPPMMYFRKDAEVPEDIVTFNWATTEVRKIGDNWKVVDGDHWILDFKSNEAQARRALAAIKFYHLNAHGFVGRPNAPMEYYLTDGKAPDGPMAGEDSIGFNPNNLSVKQVGGRWKVVEGADHWMLDFNTNEAQARQALALIKKYGFTYTCYVGRPNPPMMYFRKGAAPITEDLVPFNYNNVKAELANGNWTVVDGAHAIVSFKNSKADADKAVQIIKTYKLTAHGFVGRPNAPMEYYLADGYSPIGPIAGEDRIAFNPEKLDVKQIEGRWTVIEVLPNGQLHYMLAFGANEAQARLALLIIKSYGFSNICYVGRGVINPPMMYFRQ